MNNQRAIFVILLTILILSLAYGIMAFPAHKPRDTINISELYVNYAGADPNSTYTYVVANGSPAHVYLDINFQGNVSSNLSYVYVTTPQFSVVNWTYTFRNYTERSGPVNSTFIGSATVQGLLSSHVNSRLTSTLQVRIVSSVKSYNGTVSVHVVFTGMPGGAVY